MNEKNLLADVDVPTIEGNFSSMYMLQIALQRRLQCLPMDTTNYKHMAAKCVYWGHCIRAEIEELNEWLFEKKDPTWLKEMQMEAIDIIHFVFNLAVEIGYTDLEIKLISDAYDHQEWEHEVQRVQAANAILTSSVIKLIDLLPWKTWKTYKEAPDANKVYIEYTNVFRASLMLCNACGLSEQGIIDMYFAKNKVNHTRQDNGY